MNFPFLDGDVPRSTSYGVYISQLIRFARVSSHVDDFNTRNKVLTAKLLRQGYRYHKIRKAFSKFYRRHFDIVSKYNIGIKHGFSCINVCQVPREVLKTEAEGRGFQHLPRDLANVTVLENNV